MENVTVVLREFLSRYENCKHIYCSVRDAIPEGVEALLKQPDESKRLIPVILS